MWSVLGEHYAALKTCMKLVIHYFERLFFTLFGDFYESLATCVVFFNLAFLEIESLSSNTKNLSAVDTSTDKRETF